MGQVGPQYGRARSKGDGGFTLIELLVAMMVFTLTSGAISMTIAASMSLGRTNKETALAAEAAQGMIETLQGEDFEQIFRRYNLDPNDEVPPNSGPGMFFAVAGLDVAPDDPDGFVGEVRFPGDGFILAEDVVDADLGMPRDLNGDRDQDALDHSGDYRVLPVRVHLEWLGSGGRQTLDLVSTVARK